MGQASKVANVEERTSGTRRSVAVPLGVEHLGQALELSRALQWPYRLEDWAFALRLGHGFAVEDDGRLIGTALWWPYGEHHASTGMIIVAAEAQRKGVGGVLMDALLADAAGRTIILNATEQGLALYTRLGFVARGHVHQHQALLTQAPSSDKFEAIRNFRPADRPMLDDLDAAASGMDRKALIDALLPISSTMVIERGGRISGYGCARSWGRGIVIGPIMAADVEDARALICALAAGHVGSFVRIDVPAATGLSPWLEAIGLPQVDQVVAMTLGDPPKTAAQATLFALSNQSLG